MNFNINNTKLLQNANYWYKNAFDTEHCRKPGFLEVLSELNGRPANILEIGTTGGDINDLNGIHGSGHSTFYFAEYIRQNGGSLTIVELNPQILENCKIMLEDFVKAGINIKFVCDDGLNWAAKPDFCLKYLDAGDIEWQTFEMFKKIDLRDSSVLLDDWNSGGKCDRVKILYPFFNKVFACGPKHQMGYYRRFESFGEEKFKIGNLELNYYRGWKGNREATNERALEVPLGQFFLEKFEKVIELGAVMPYYCDNGSKSPDEVVDPYDKFEKCFKIDGEEYDYTQKNVLSLSTLEHIGNDNGYDSKLDQQKAARVIEKIINQSKNYLLCWGIGQHPKLDEYVQKSNLNVNILVRENRRGLINNWKEDSDKNNLYLPYGNWDMACEYYGHSLGLAVVSNNLF